MTKTEGIKFVSRIVITLGSGKIVASIVRNNVPVESLPQKAILSVTAFAIGGMLAGVTSDYTDRQIDEIADILSGKKEIKIV